MKPKALDLFCGGGGAAEGLMRAGFQVIGVDNVASHGKNYPGLFVLGDALAPPIRLEDFAFIWASPPCQAFSQVTRTAPGGRKHPNLIPPTRAMLEAAGVPYCIENVEGAPLKSPAVLCGTMFPGLRVIRHRLFETNFLLLTPNHGPHPLVHTLDKRKAHYGKTDEWEDFVQVTGGGNCSTAAAQDAMGIPWLPKPQLNEAIPPAYAEFIGRQVLHRAD